jgi:hypothetical protein
MNSLAHGRIIYLPQFQIDHPCDVDVVSDDKDRLPGGCLLRITSFAPHCLAMIAGVGRRSA